MNFESFYRLLCLFQLRVLFFFSRFRFLFWYGKELINEILFLPYSDLPTAINETELWQKEPARERFEDGYGYQILYPTLAKWLEKRSLFRGLFWGFFINTLCGLKLLIPCNIDVLEEYRIPGMADVYVVSTKFRLIFERYEEEGFTFDFYLYFLLVASGFSSKSLH